MPVMSEMGATSSLAAMRGTTLCQTSNRELLLLLHPFNGLFSKTTWVRRYQKSKSILHLNQARDDGVLGCSGISWTICKQSAPRSRQITMPTPHHSIFTGRMLFLMPNQQCHNTEGLRLTCQQRIIKDKSNVLFYFLPAKRDVQLTTRLRRARQYPTIYARTTHTRLTALCPGLPR